MVASRNTFVGAQRVTKLGEPGLDGEPWVAQSLPTSLDTALPSRGERPHGGDFQAGPLGCPEMQA